MSMESQQVKKETIMLDQDIVSCIFSVVFHSLLKLYLLNMKILIIITWWLFDFLKSIENLSYSKQ